MSNFNNLGYILHKVNHNIWFGQGHFHTNSIEGTWSRLKRLTRSFTGINGNIFNTNKNLLIMTISIVGFVQEFFL